MRVAYAFEQGGSLCIKSQNLCEHKQFGAKHLSWDVKQGSGT